MTMNIILITSISILAIFYFLYVGLIQARNEMQAALSSVKVQLTKRYDLISNLLKIAKSFMKHEEKLLTEIVNLRNNAATELVNNNVTDLFKAENKLKSGLDKLLVTVEAYPELKSSEAIQNVMVANKDVEDNISAARRYYNSAVKALNDKVDVFPTSVIAGVCHVDRQPYYETDDETVKNIDVNKYLD